MAPSYLCRYLMEVLLFISFQGLGSLPVSRVKIFRSLGASIGFLVVLPFVKNCYAAPSLWLPVCARVTARYWEPAPTLVVMCTVLTVWTVQVLGNLSVNIFNPFELHKTFFWSGPPCTFPKLFCKEQVAPFLCYRTGQTYTLICHHTKIFSFKWSPFRSLCVSRLPSPTCKSDLICSWVPWTYDDDCSVKFTILFLALPNTLITREVYACSGSIGKLVFSWIGTKGWAFLHGYNRY